MPNTLTPLNQFLSTGFDGSGTFRFIGNYAAGEEAGITAPADTRLHLRRMIIGIEDGTMTASKFGALTALTNGVSFEYRDPSDTVLASINASPIKQNSHWARYCYDSEIQARGGGNDWLRVRWSFDKAYGPNAEGNEVFVLNPGYKLVMTLDDNLTGLVDFTVLVQGRAEDLG